MNRYIEKTIYAAALSASAIGLGAAMSSCGDSTPDYDTPDDLYVLESTLEFEASGGYQFLNVVSENIAWRVESVQPWVAVAPSAGASSASVRVEAQPNTTSAARRDTIFINSTYAAHPSSIPVVIVQSGK